MFAAYDDDEKGGRKADQSSETCLAVEATTTTTEAHLGKILAAAAAEKLRIGSILGPRIVGNTGCRWNCCC